MALRVEFPNPKNLKGKANFEVHFHVFQIASYN